MATTSIERPSPYSTDAAARRKSNKPLMEKKRRERINKCLNELQALLLENSKEHSHSKLEKADILEMTVKHIRSIRRQAISGFNQRSQEEMRPRRTYPECSAPQTSQLTHKQPMPHPGLTVQIPTPPTSPVSLHSVSPPQHIYQGSFVPMSTGGVALLINHQQAPAMAHHEHSVSMNNIVTRHQNISPARSHPAENVWRPWG